MMAVFFRNNKVFELLFVFLFLVTSCKKENTTVISSRVKPTFKDNSAIVANYNNEIGIIDLEGFSGILRVREEISAIFEFNDYVVAITDINDNRKIAYKISKDGKVLDKLTDFKCKFIDCLQIEDTIYFLGSSFHKLHTHQKLEFKNNFEISTGHKISLIEKLSSGNNIFILDEFFIMEKEDLIKILNKNIFFNAGKLDLYSDKTFAIHVAENNVFNFKRDSINGNTIDILNKGNGKLENKYQFKVEYPELRSDGNNIIAYNLKELEVFVVSEQKKIIDINSSNFFIIDAAVRNDMLVILTKNSLVKIPLINNGSAIQRLQNKRLLKDFDAEIIWYN